MSLPSYSPCSHCVPIQIEYKKRTTVIGMEFQWFRDVVTVVCSLMVQGVIPLHHDYAIDSELERLNSLTQLRPLALDS